MSENNHTSNAMSALGGAFVGALVGEGGLFGGNRNNNNAVTPDQLQTTISNLQSQISTDTIQSQLNGISGQICNSTSDITAAVTGSGNSVKDAVVGASALNQLALCELGHKMSAGFAAVNQNITIQGYEAQKLALQQGLDSERARATELRIALSEHKNQAGHSATQVQIQQLVGALGK